VFFSGEDDFGGLVNLGGLMFIYLQEFWFGWGQVASCLVVLFLIFDDLIGSFLCRSGTSSVGSRRKGSTSRVTVFSCIYINFPNSSVSCWLTS